VTVDLDRIGPRTLFVDCDVIQADGGTRTAAITGAYVALTQAMRDLERRGLVRVGAIRTAVAATSVGIVHGEPVLDLNYLEDSRAEVDFNMVMTREGRLVEVQGTAEGEPFTRQAMDGLLDLAGRGIGRLFELQEAALAEAGAR
jgi:ribonuclease PH